MPPAPVPLASEDELKLIAQLRESLKPDLEKYLTEAQRSFEELTGDVRLLRFLRGYKHVVPDAAEAYRKMLVWYQQDNIGAIRDDIVNNKLTLETLPHSELVLKYYLANVWHNDDVNGNVFNLELTGQIEPKDLNVNLPEETFITWHKYHLEFKALYVDAQSRKLNRLIRTFAIKDLRGLGLKHAHQPTLALLHRAIKIGTENYPEMLEKLLIINAPSIFNMIWAIVRPMINQNTIEKIGIFGVSGYQDIIKQHFDLKLVPIIVGGSCISCVGGCIKNCPGSGANADGSQTLEIAAGTKYEMSVELAALNELKWSFVSKDYDVPFTVTFQPEDGEIIKVSSESIAAGKEAVGSYKPTQTGELKLLWDNTSSYFRSKTIVFKTEVVSPNHTVPDE